MASLESQDTAAAERASGSSFYTAMRILPRAQREAMFEIYSFCRQVDDIADSIGPRDERRRALDRWRADIDALYAVRTGAASRRARPARCANSAFGARTSSTSSTAWRWTSSPTSARRTMRRSTVYCDRVASAVGRLSVRVFGMEEEDGIALAHHLGRALQLTNILRDLDEDAALGRLYLPAEGLRAAGITTTDPAAVLASPALGPVCATLVERARRHFAEADAIMARSPRRSVRAPRIMSEAYKLILDRLVARGWSPPRDKIRIPRLRLLWIIMQNAFV